MLLDAHVFLDIAKGEIIGNRCPAFDKLLNHHKLILNKRLRKHYSGILYKQGEPALRYIDSVEDAAPIENVTANEFYPVKLDSRHRPAHRKDVFLVKIAIAARRRSNNVVLVSEDAHLRNLDPVYHTDYGIRILPAADYVQHFCNNNLRGLMMPRN